MTKKRFTWLKKDVYVPQIVITDSLTEKDLTPTDCYELLNELADENEELKEEIKGFESCSHNWGILYDEVKNKVKVLSKENKELRQQIKNSRTIVSDSIYEANKIQCNCNPCIVEEYVKKVIK